MFKIIIFSHWRRVFVFNGRTWCYVSTVYTIYTILFVLIRSLCTDVHIIMQSVVEGRTKASLACERTPSTLSFLPCWGDGWTFRLAVFVYLSSFPVKRDTLCIWYKYPQSICLFVRTILAIILQHKGHSTFEFGKHFV